MTNSLNGQWSLCLDLATRFELTDRAEDLDETIDCGLEHLQRLPLDHEDRSDTKKTLPASLSTDSNALKTLKTLTAITFRWEPFHRVASYVFEPCPRPLMTFTSPLNHRKITESTRGNPTEAGVGCYYFRKLPPK